MFRKGRTIRTSTRIATWTRSLANGTLGEASISSCSRYGPASTDSCGWVGTVHFGYKKQPIAPHFVSLISDVYRENDVGTLCTSR